MNMEGLPGVLGNKGTREHEPIFREQETKLYKLEDKNILI